MATIQKPENIKCWQSREKLEPLWAVTGIIKRCNFYEKHYGGSLEKIKNFLSYDPTMPLSHVHSKELKVDSQRDACILTQSHCPQRSRGKTMQTPIQGSMDKQKSDTHTFIHTHTFTHTQCHPPPLTVIQP